MNREFKFTDDELIILAHEKVAKENPELNRCKFHAHVYVENREFKGIALTYSELENDTTHD